MPEFWDHNFFYCIVKFSMALVRAIENFTTAQKKLWSQNYGVKSVRVDGPLVTVYTDRFYARIRGAIFKFTAL